MPAYLDIKNQQTKNGKYIDITIGETTSKVEVMKQNEDTYFVDIPTNILYDENYIEKTKEIMAKRKAEKQNQKLAKKEKNDNGAFEELMAQVKDLPQEKIKDVIKALEKKQ